MKNKFVILGILVILIVLVIAIIGGINRIQEKLPSIAPPAHPEPQEPSVLKTEPIDLSKAATEKKVHMAAFYSLDALDIPLKAPQYNLPLETSHISNFNDFSEKIPLSNEALNLLKKNGFVVIENPFYSKEEDITSPYKNLKNGEIPIFITSDSLLHLYHIQFDETLRQIEEKEFYDKIWEISYELFNNSLQNYNKADGDLKEALKRNIAYLSVGLKLLQPKEDQLCKDKRQCQDPGIASAYFTPQDLEKYKFEVPDFVKSIVLKELKLMEEHKGFSLSPLFIYKEDYSQYVPRGHYTRSEKLKNYFKAMMWYGRMSMLLKGTDQVEPGKTCSDFPPCKAFISLYDAKIQTMQAALISAEFAKSKELMDKWKRIYTVTSFYVGVSDDLGPYEYIEALNFVFNGKFKPSNLTDENIGKLKAKLAEYRAPKIYGGTGEAYLSPPFTPEEADKVLERTKGFRLMGQRFIPDSYVFQNLVFPKVGEYVGKNCGQTFTCYDDSRYLPRGLDVMALLGSKRAKEILIKLGDTEYKYKYDDKISYKSQFQKLKEEFDSFSQEEWQKNLYWSWLYALKALLKQFGKGYPTFMQTEPWQDKELNTALASWTELRHDTILYAKQSYTMGKTAIPFEKPAVGYVEPVPEFYNRLLALTRMTTNGLEAMNVLDDTAKSRLKELEKILEKLVKLSKKELKNEELTQEDYDFIKNFGKELNRVIAGVDRKAKKTTIVADVHTDISTSTVLEEGVGYVNLVVVAYKVPDGRILLGAGPVMSYFEFKQSIDDRLTDEKWRNMLESNPPEKPKWVSSFRE